MEITVCASCHAVVFKVGQLVGTLVECYGQFAAGIVVAENDVGNGISALFSAIPCLNDCIAVLAFGYKSHGTARAIYEYDFLACLMEHSHQVALHLRQLYADAVAAAKSGFVNFHLFTFKAW